MCVFIYVCIYKILTYNIDCIKTAVLYVCCTRSIFPCSTAVSCCYAGLQDAGSPSVSQSFLLEQAGGQLRKPLMLSR